jgi:hypothetical protein
VAYWSASRHVRGRHVGCSCSILCQVEITGDQEYEAQEIEVKLDYGKLLYRASWVGYDEDLDFYLASDFKYAPHKLRYFHAANPSLLGPPRALDR